jgi:ABC-2 type transport system ATP-binding protein
MSVQVDHLYKSYGHQPAIQDISFSLAPGKILGFLGPNGAGKSTTLKIITGYLQPDQGEVRVCGIDTRTQSLEVREYLRFLADLHHLRNKKERIAQVIEQVGLTPESGKKNKQLSKGYKQRVGLAAALLHDPEVLILDEPTTGLDPNQIIEIRQVIKDWGRNKTVIFSSHILQEVEALCDEIVIIQKGSLVAHQPLPELLRQHPSRNLESIFRELTSPVHPPAP